MANLFFDLSIIIIVGTVMAYVLKLFRQPLIPAYICAGLILGPIFNIIPDREIISHFSEIGIAFLLFIVGLEIDLKKLKNVAAISSIGGLINSFILFSLGSMLAFALGFHSTEAIYVGLALAFSSTAIVLKLLSDKREIDTLHGRIIIGILLMEDILVIIALSALSNTALSSLSIIFSFAKVIVLLIVAFLLSKFILPSVYHFAAKSQEILFLLSLSICFLFSMMASQMGISIVIGSFIAGVALGNLPYNLEVIAKIKPLKDFFSTIFFISLGLNLALDSILPALVPILLLSVIILLFKPMIIMTICSVFGYKKRPSFLTAISLSQISEFSLILVAQGFLMGHISQNLLSTVTILAGITMTTTSYFIKFDNEIYRLVSRYIAVFEKIPRKHHHMEYFPDKIKNDIILCGYNRIGYSIVKTIRKLNKNLLVVDYNPEVITMMIEEKIPCIYGDIGDTEILDRMNMRDAEVVISTIPEKQDNLLLIKKLKHVNKKAVIFVTSSDVDEALELYDAGADYVILPHFLGGEHVSLLLEDFTLDLNKVLKTKIEHIDELMKRKHHGHNHPANA